MAEIINDTGQPLHSDSFTNIPSPWVPSFRTCLAIQNGVEHNLLMMPSGGIGDVACAEPAIRFCIEEYGKYGNDISLSTFWPEIFQHLSFKKVYHLPHEFPDESKYLGFNSLYDTNHIAWEFIAHIAVQAVDYASLNMFRRQLPIKYRTIKLVPKPNEMDKADFLVDPKTDIVIHPGKSWSTKTFPAWWYVELCREIFSRGYRPVIIGASNASREKGYVEFNAEGCLDLRDKLSLMETVAVMQTANVVIGPDSGPIHMASSGRAWIGLLSTVKDPDLLMHWRKDGEETKWAWRTENLTLGGMWVGMNMCPNNPEEIKVDKVDPETVLSWLPTPQSVAIWGMERCHLT